MLYFRIYIPEFLMAIVFVTLLAILLLYIDRKFELSKVSWFKKLPVAALCLLWFVQPRGVVYNIYQISKINKLAVASFEECLSKIGIPSDEYVYPKKINAQSGKNIIILSLESFEASYLKENLAYLTPNLNKLAKENQYYHMAPDEGSSWTLSSLYTFLTGVPMYIEGDKSTIFKNAHSTRLTSISHVLNKAAYKQLYLMGKPEFGATNDLLKLYQIDLKSEKNISDAYLKTNWGLHDSDLFNQIKKEIDQLSKIDQPFVLYASTISTHGPSGVYDARMEKFIEPQESSLAFMIKAVDYLIGDLINYLKENDLLENTVFYIFPDHALMGANMGIAHEFQDPGSLFLLTNATKQLDRYSTNDTILQIDLPVLILEGAEIDHNAKFMTEFIPGDKKSFLKEKKSEFLTLNQEALIEKEGQ